MFYTVGFKSNCEKSLKLNQIRNKRTNSIMGKTTGKSGTKSVKKATSAKITKTKTKPSNTPTQSCTITPARTRRQTKLLAPKGGPMIRDFKFENNPLLSQLKAGGNSSKHQNLNLDQTVDQNQPIQIDQAAKIASFSQAQPLNDGQLAQSAAPQVIGNPEASLEEDESVKIRPKHDRVVQDDQEDLDNDEEKNEGGLADFEQSESDQHYYRARVDGSQAFLDQKLTHWPAFIRMLADNDAIRTNIMQTHASYVLMAGFMGTPVQHKMQMAIDWAQSLPSSDYLESLKDSKHDLNSVLAPIDHLNLIFKVLKEGQVDHYSLAFLGNAFIGKVGQLCNNVVDMIEGTNEFSVVLFLQSMLAKLFTQNKEQLRQAHIAIALKSGLGAQVFSLMLEHQVCKSLDEFNWAVLTAGSQRGNRSQKKRTPLRVIWNGFSLAYGSLTAKGLKAIFEHGGLLCTTEVLQAMNQVPQSSQAFIATLIGTNVQDSPDVGEVVRSVTQILTNSQAGPTICKALSDKERPTQYGKLSGDDFISLLDACKALNATEIALSVQQSTTLAGLKTALECQVKGRTNKELNFDDLDQAVQTRLGQESVTVQQAYQEFAQISQEMSNLKAGYKHNAYQCFIAASLACGVTRFRLCALGAGQGKSFVMLLLGLHLLKTFKSVVIVCKDALIKSQFQTHINDYKSCCRATKCLLIAQTTNDFAQMAQSGDQVVIIDEADAYFRENMLTWNGQTENGIACLRKRKTQTPVFMFTATMSVYWTKVIQKAFSSENVLVNRFQDSLVFMGKPGTATSITGVAYYSKAEVETQFVSCVQRLSMSDPVIAFTTGDIERCCSLLEPLKQNNKLKITRIDTIEYATQLRKLAGAEMGGIFIMSRNFYRGFDLKLGLDAKVCILDTESDLIWSEAQQMIGRGCRTLGTAYGYIFTLDQVSAALSTVRIGQILEKREFQDDDAGDELLELALRTIDGEQDSKNLALIKRTFGEKKWRQSWEAYLDFSNGRDSAARYAKALLDD